MGTSRRPKMYGEPFHIRRRMKSSSRNAGTKENISAAASPGRSDKAESSTTAPATRPTPSSSSPRISKSWRMRCDGRWGGKQSRARDRAWVRARSTRLKGRPETGKSSGALGRDGSPSRPFAEGATHLGRRPILSSFNGGLGEPALPPATSECPLPERRTRNQERLTLNHPVSAPLERPFHNSTYHQP
ncbi:hypothetical protein EMGBS6_12440 [Opitutia bacterium]|nr:hypothetical protein EMGBS6_12440 [Opitutae bacterium]